MDLISLGIFKAVADSGSVSRAAASLHYVQSNISARIQRLEEELEVQLFVRSRRGMTLTAGGETLLVYANRLLQLADEARRSVSATREAAGPLRLGSMETTLAVRLPGVLRDFHQRYPDIELRLRTGTVDQLVEAVLDYRLDAALVAGEVRHNAIDYTPVFRERLSLIMPPGIGDIGALPDQTLIAFPQGCVYRAFAEQWLRERGLAPLRIMELATLDGILACIRAGLGFSVFPRSSVARGEADVELCVRELDASVLTGLIRLKSAPAHRGLEVFEALLAQARGASEAGGA